MSTDTPFTFSDEELEASKLLSRDLLKKAEEVSLQTARFLRKAYYTYQKERIAKAAMIREAKKKGDPTELLEHLMNGDALLEKQTGSILLRFAKGSQAGRWALKQKGVGGLLVANLMAMIDLDEAVSPSHMISHAGLNPKQKWGKGERRPFNVEFKTLAAFKLGESFVKVQNAEDAFYGDLFKQFKEEEMTRNDRGDHVEYAKDKADNKRYGASTDAWAWVNGCFPGGACKELADIVNLPLPEEIMELEGAEFRKARDKWRQEVRMETFNRLKGEPGSGQPMIPPAQVHGRARRRVAKIFLQHFWEELYLERYNVEPPKPYVFEHMAHIHQIKRPDANEVDPNKPQLEPPTIPFSRTPEGIKIRQEREAKFKKNKDAAAEEGYSEDAA